MTKFAVIEALNEPERMARILQKRSNVNSNTLNPMYNRTPILWATHSGNDAIVRILLVQNDINPIEVDKWSWRIQPLDMEQACTQPSTFPLDGLCN